MGRLGIGAMDLIKRFNHSGSPGENSSLQNNESAVGRVSDETLEMVDWKRVPFNWPADNLPQGNFFCIQGMATDVLERSGHVKEARLLARVFSLLEVSYAELENILHPFLDFAPVSLSDEQRERLASIARDSNLDGASLVPKKHELKNPLFHKRQSLSDEWAWLVGNVGVESVYGKDAAAEMSSENVSRLVNSWLGGMVKGMAPGDPKDSSVGNLSWFEENYPIGWLALDNFHDSPIVSPGRSFEQSVELAVFEEASKGLRGWPSADVRRMGFDHKNRVGLTGSALLFLGATDWLKANGSNLISGGGPSDQDGFCKYMEWANQGTGTVGWTRTGWIWAAYNVLSPEAAAAAKETWLSDDKTKDKDKRSLAMFENMEMSIMGLGIKRPTMNEKGVPAKDRKKMRFPSV